MRGRGCASAQESLNDTAGQEIRIHKTEADI